jgi:hypothetical protein
VDLLVALEVAPELGQPQGIERVRDHVGVRAVGEPFLLEPGAQPLVERVAVAREQLLPRQAARRVLGMQVERQPGHLGVELAPEPLGQGLAEPAERSDVVRPDEDLVLGHRRAR